MADVTEHGFVKLKEFKGLDHVVNAWFIAVPFGDRDSTLMPHTADSAYLGDANRAAKYWYMWDALAIILSIVQVEGQVGGILPTFNIKDNVEQWRKVLYALATRDDGQNPQMRQYAEMMLSKYTTRNALFSDTINRMVKAERERVKKKREEEEQNKLREARVNSVTAAQMKMHTISMIGTNRVGQSEARWVRARGRGMTRLQSAFNDGYDDQERAARNRALLSDISGGGGEEDEEEEDEEGRQRDSLLNSELSLDGTGRASLSSSSINAAMTEGGAMTDVMPKFELLAFAIPREKRGFRDEEDDEEDGGGGGENSSGGGGGGRGAVKRSRQLFDELGVTAHEDECINEMGGMVYVLAQMDPTINGGKAMEKNLRDAELRAKYGAMVASESSSRAGGGRTRPGLMYDPKLDSHKDLLLGRHNNFPTLKMNKRRMVEALMLYTATSVEEEEVDQIARGSFPSDTKSPLYPSNWATLENAVRILRATGCDVSGLTPENIFKGYAERASTGAADPMRDKYSMINLTVPVDPDTGAPYYKAYRWPVHHHQLVDPRPAQYGLLDQWFPFIDPKKVQTRDQLFAVESRAIQRHEDSAEAQRMAADPLGLLPPGTSIHVEHQQRVFAEGASHREWRAPYETDDAMQHAYYAGIVLTAQTLKSYTDDPEQWESWMIAQRRQEQLCYPLYKDMMAKDARINKYALAMNIWGDSIRKVMTNPSVPIFLHDVGKPLDPADKFGPRHPEHPALDAFAHDKIRNNYYLRQIKGVEAPLVIQRCQKVGTTCFHFKPGRLNPVFVLSGTAGTGKTYVIKAVNSMLVPGMYMGQNHTSEGVLTAQGMVDMAINTDEGAGLVEDKKMASSRKTELAKTAINGMGVVSASRSAYKTDAMGNKTLQADHTEVCHNNSYLIATNSSRGDIDEAMLARCIFIEKKEAFSLAVELTFENIEQMNKAFQTSQRLQQYMVYLVHKAVQCGYIPDFTQMPMVDIILQKLTRWLLSMGMTPQENNSWDRVHNKIKIGIHDSVARNAIIETFNLPGGSRFRVDEGGWELSFMREVSVKLFPTLQIIFWEVMEHEHEWIGDVSMTVEMLKAALAVGGYEWNEGHTASDQYMYDVNDEVRWRNRMRHDVSDERPRNEMPAFRTGTPAGETEERQQYTRKVALVDLNYVRLQETGTLWQQISNAMPAWCRMQPSRIKGYFQRMSNMSMFVPTRAPYKPQTRADLAPVRNQEIRYDASGAKVTSYDLAERDDTQFGKPIPMVEMTSANKFGTGTIYVATEAPEVMSRVDLVRGLLMAACSGVMKPRKIALPVTHREYHDVIETINITQSVIDNIVEMKDAKQERNYRLMMAKRGVFDEARLPRTIGAACYDMARVESGPAPGFAEEGEEEEQPEIMDVDEDEDDGDAAWLGEDEDDDDEEEEAMLAAGGGPGGDGPGGGASAAEMDPNRMRRVGELQYDWRHDKMYLSARYGIQVPDQSAISKVGRAFMETKIDERMTSEEWEGVQERVKECFSGRLKFITVDPDVYSASVRWKRCAMPLHNNGKPVRMPDWSYSLECYLQYMSEHPEIQVTEVNYPDDEIEARRKGSSIMQVVHGSTVEEDFEAYFPEDWDDVERERRLKFYKESEKRVYETEKRYKELSLRSFETTRTNYATDAGMAIARRPRSRMERVLRGRAARATMPQVSRVRQQQQSQYVAHRTLSVTGALTSPLAGGRQ